VKALSIRQPWAWLIVNGHKDIENRTWSTHFRGRVLVHAGATMTRGDYEACVLFIAQMNTTWRLPAPDVLRQQCSGIVGEVDIVGCVQESFSPWFTGDFGFVLCHPKPLPFRPCKGALKFFTPVS
jgi:ASCH domain